MNWKRIRVWLTRRLLRGTGCAVTRTSEMREIKELADDLAQYVEASGGLQDPRRIEAYRRVLRFAGALKKSAERIEAAA